MLHKDLITEWARMKNYLKILNSNYQDLLKSKYLCFNILQRDSLSCKSRN